MCTFLFHDAMLLLSFLFPLLRFLQYHLPHLFTNNSIIQLIDLWNLILFLIPALSSVPFYLDLLETSFRVSFKWPLLLAPAAISSFLFSDLFLCYFSPILRLQNIYQPHSLSLSFFLPFILSTQNVQYIFFFIFFSPIHTNHIHIFFSDLKGNIYFVFLKKKCILSF